VNDANPYIGSNFDDFLAEENIRIKGAMKFAQRGIKMTRFRFRKMRKPYGRKLLIPLRYRFRTPLVVRRYGLIARLR
jgi:hypothetical protein